MIRSKAKTIFRLDWQFGNRSTLSSENELRTKNNYQPDPLETKEKYLKFTWTNYKQKEIFIAYLYMWRAPKHVLFKKGWRHTFKFLSLRKFSNQKWPFFVKEKSNKIFLLSKLFYFTFFRDVTSFIAELCAGTTTYGQNLKKKKKVFFFF
jgi:hypothetical protein